MNNYNFNDIRDLYAMKAYELPVKMETDPQFGPYQVHSEENDKMYETIMNATSIQQAKDLYTQYAEKYPPIQYNYED